MSRLPHGWTAREHSAWLEDAEGAPLSLAQPVEAPLREEPMLEALRLAWRQHAAGVALQAVRALVGRVGLTQAVEHALQQSLRLLTPGPGAPCEVRVHPSDAAWMSSCIDAAWLCVRADATLAPGDVVLASEAGVVDGRLQTRFEELAVRFTPR